MPTYKYKGRNTKGAAVEGSFEGENENAVVQHLRKTNIIPTSIKESRNNAGRLNAIMHMKIGGNSVKQADLIFFCQQMHSLLKAGVPILSALKGLGDTTENERLAAIISNIIESLEAGMDLHVAFAKHPKVFSDLFISIVEVGSQSGNLEESFKRLASYLAREIATKNSIKSAMRYPVFVLGFIFVAMMGLTLFVIPVFSRVFEKFGKDLPILTKVLIESSNFMVNYWYIVIAIIVSVAYAARFYISRPKGRFLWHKYKLRLPIIGSILYRATLSRFSQAVSITVRSGLPWDSGMNTVSRVVDNDYIAKAVQEIREKVVNGSSFVRAAAETKVFSPIVLQMISVGEESGNLDEMMQEVSEYYDREVDYALKSISTAIEPILLVIVGVMVLILALGIFMPLWQLSSIASRN